MTRPLCPGFRADLTPDAVGTRRSVAITCPVCSRVVASLARWDRDGVPFAVAPAHLAPADAGRKRARS